MKLFIDITGLPLPAHFPPRFAEEGDCGSEVEFRGKIRQNEKGALISGLHYEAYEKMARIEIERILLDLNQTWPCLSAELIHRIGWVPANEASIFVRIRSSHRREGFLFLAELMNRLKADVPIWKAS